MRNAAGELADLLQPLALRQLQFQLLQTGQVGEAHDGAADGAVRLGERVHRDADGHRAAGAAEFGIEDARLIAGDAIGAGEQAADRAAGAEFAGGNDLAHREVGAHHATALVHGQRRRCGLIEQQAQQRIGRDCTLAREQIDQPRRRPFAELPTQPALHRAAPATMPRRRQT